MDPEVTPPVVAPAVTPLPRKPIIGIFVSLFANSVLITMCFPFLPFMVRDYGIPEEEVGDYVGLLASGFFLGQALTSYYPWGVWSDRYGRRPVILVGLFMMGLLSVIFGLSKSMWVGVAIRFLMGAFNGAVPACKTMLAEVCDETNQGVGMSLLTTSWGCGLVIGPVIGGFLSRPASKFEMFHHSTLLHTYPYLLPCLVGSFMSLLGTTTAYFCLHETLGTRKNNATTASMDSEHGAIDTPRDNECEKGLEKTNEPVTDQEPSTFAGLLADAQVRLSVLLYCVLSYAVVSFDELFPLWASTPFHFGGLAWTTSDIGMLMAMVGVTMIFAQLASFKLLEERVGIIALFKYCSVACAAAVLAMPVTHYFQTSIPILELRANTSSVVVTTVAANASSAPPRHGAVAQQHQVDSPLLLWVVVTFVMLLFRVAVGNCFVANALFLNNSVSSARRGALNGMAMTFSTVTRTLAPTLSGVIFAWSIGGNHVFPFNFFSVFVVISIMLLWCATLTNKLPTNISKQR